MQTFEKREAWLAKLARAGHQRPLGELSKLYAPLVYHVVGHMLGNVPAAERAVWQVMEQVRTDTWLRRELSPRASIVALAIGAARQFRPASRIAPQVTGAVDPAGPDLVDPAGPDLVDPAGPDLVDPAGVDRAGPGLVDPAGPDFVDTAIAKLDLSGPARQLLEATRWLEPADREPLALWWLVEMGELTREEVGSALRVVAEEVDERLRPVVARLAATREVVAALQADPACRVVTILAASVRPHQPYWRERLEKHVRRCDNCARVTRQLPPTAPLIAGLGLVPPPEHLAPPTAGGRRADHALGEYGGAAPSPGDGGIGGAAMTWPQRSRASRLRRWLRTGPVVVAGIATVALVMGLAIGRPSESSPTVEGPPSPPRLTEVSPTPAPAYERTSSAVSASSRVASSGAAPAGSPSPTASMPAGSGATSGSGGGLAEAAGTGSGDAGSGPADAGDEPGSQARPSAPSPPEPFSASYEAEAARLIGQAEVVSMAAASGGKIVHKLGTEQTGGEDGGSSSRSGAIEFTSVNVPASGSYTMTVFYVSGEARSAYVQVNGAGPILLSASACGDWDMVCSAELSVDLRAGTNSVQFSHPTYWAPRLDRITIAR